VLSLIAVATKTAVKHQTKAPQLWLCTEMMSIAHASIGVHHRWMASQAANLNKK
jgi:hypothetical protein